MRQPTAIDWVARVRFTIFGGRGFIGRHLVSYLRGCGHEVLDQEASDLSSQSKNLGNVIYSIGLTGDFRSRPYDTVEAHTSLLSRLLQTQVFDSWTYLSSTRIYSSNDSNRSAHEEDELLLKPSRDSLYDLTKLTGEALCLSSSNPQVRVARLSNVYGAGMNVNTFLGSILDRLINGQDVEIGEAPLSEKDYIAISDVCRCIENISTIGHRRVYNVASGKNTTHGQIATHLNAIAKTNIRFKPQSALRRFPQIDNSRLMEEFSFEPRNLDQDLAELLNDQAHHRQKANL